ncbi:DNA glycosylase [Panus rudis PR-1116 ss-1]|nr:DNA glycosylase [Panus rudis PR-1116 ss-1]
MDVEKVVIKKEESFKATLENFKFVARRSTRILSKASSGSQVPVKAEPKVEDEEKPLVLLGSDTLAVPQAPRKRKVSKTFDDGPIIKKTKRGFAPPEKYAHLNFLQDYLQDYLDIMFCGINPGCKSAEVGHHFANPTNHFWKCLHRSELTDRLLPPTEDFTLPQAYNIGLTNLVDRPSAEQAELSNQDMVSGVPVLLSKIARFKPRVVCFVGKGIWTVFHKEASKRVDVSSSHVSSESSSASTTPTDPSVEEDNKPAKSAKKSKAKSAKTQHVIFDWGLQPCKVVHPILEDGSAPLVPETLFFVMPSTSGRVVSHQLKDKVVLFAALRERVSEAKDMKIDTTTMSVIPIPAQSGDGS